MDQTSSNIYNDNIIITQPIVKRMVLILAFGVWHLANTKTVSVVFGGAGFN